MNPWNLDATGLMVWGLVAHLIADWPLQSDWMAQRKASLRHPAGYVHAAVHGVALALVFGWPAILLAVAHLLIDTRRPVAWLSRLMRQTQPGMLIHWSSRGMGYEADVGTRVDGPVLVDLGMTVRIWTDQVWHVACVAVAALLVS